MSKRLERMFKWIDANPYCVYGAYNDEIDDKSANLILAGDFEGFYESWSEVEFNATDYIDWSDWEKEFAKEFGYDSWDDISEHIQQIAIENRQTDCSDLLRVCLRNWRGHVCARLINGKGEFIEFPSPYEHDENALRARYLRRYCGLEGDSECNYDGTYLTAIGKADLWQILQEHKKPEYITLKKGACFTIGHEPMNGSGTMANDMFNSPIERTFKAKFYIDGTSGYGIDSIYGLTGKCWSNDLWIADCPKGKES